MSEEGKGGAGGREQGLAEAAASVRALRDSMGEAGAAQASGASAERTSEASEASDTSEASEASEASEGASARGEAAGKASATGKGSSGSAGRGTEGAPAAPAVPAAPAAVTPPAPTAPAAVTPPAPTPATRAARTPARELEDELDDEAVSRELRGGSWRRWAALGLLVAVVLGVGAVVLLGQRNGERYLLRCTAEHIVAEQGRTFPPWGERTLSGKQWKPISLPLAAECRDRQAQSELELAGWFAEALMEQAGPVLAAGKLDQLEAAAAQLEQASLLTRAPERRAERAQLQRLWGDVEYGRALAKLAQARQALAEAARGLDEAAKKEPRYATDAAARAKELRRLLAELGAPGVAEAGAPQRPLPGLAPAASEPSSPLPPSTPEAPAAPAAPAPAGSEPEPTPDAGPATSAPIGEPTASAPTPPTAPGAPPATAPGGASGSASPPSTPPPAPAAPTPAPVPAGGVLL